MHHWLRALAFVALGREAPQSGPGRGRRPRAEFPFERDLDNVRQAANDRHVGHPIGLGSDLRRLARSATRTGPPSTSPTRKNESATTSSGRAETTMRTRGPAAAARRADQRRSSKTAMLLRTSSRSASSVSAAGSLTPPSSAPKIARAEAEYVSCGDAEHSRPSLHRRSATTTPRAEFLVLQERNRLEPAVLEQHLGPPPSTIGQVPSGSWASASSPCQTPT